MRISGNYNNERTYLLTRTSLLVGESLVCTYIVYVCMCVHSPLTLAHGLFHLSLCLILLLLFFAEKAKQNATMTSTFVVLSHTLTQTHTANFNVDNCEKCAEKEIAQTLSTLTSAAR